MLNLNDLPQIYNIILPIFSFAFLCALLLTPIVGKLSYRFKLIDLPGRLREAQDNTRGRRIHKKTTPLAGGTAVIIPFLILVFLTVGLTKASTGIFIGTLIIFITGLVDDRYGLPAKIQFLMHWVGALVVVIYGLSIDTLNIPLIGELNLDWYHFDLISNYGVSLPADLITAFWIVVVINAIKWVNGSDGLAEGVSVISGVAIMFIAIEQGFGNVAIIAAIFSGALLGFLPFNFYPAKIFSGAGGPAYGFILAVLAILSGGKLSTAILLLSLPLIDMVWVIIGRMRTHKTYNVLKIMNVSDKTHLHHRLLDLGFNVKQVAYIEYTLVTVIGTIALFASELDKVGVIAIVVSLIIGLFVLINIFTIRNGKIKIQKDSPKPLDPTKEETPESKYTY